MENPGYPRYAKWPRVSFNWTSLTLVTLFLRIKEINDPAPVSEAINLGRASQTEVKIRGRADYRTIILSSPAGNVNCRVNPA